MVLLGESGGRRTVALFLQELFEDVLIDALVDTVVVIGRSRWAVCWLLGLGLASEPYRVGERALVALR
ncbi:MAG: hypothetical protein ACJ74U_10800 [Jatrophihabitantaceae bacterium]